MGANIEVKNERIVSGEPVATICAKTSELFGIDIPKEFVSIAIDELPIILIAAACAKGKTRLTGAQELRIKESDRIQSMSDGFLNLNIKIEQFDDGMIVEGGEFSGGIINSNDDHRIAMAFACLLYTSPSPRDRQKSRMPSSA